MRFLAVVVAVAALFVAKDVPDAGVPLAGIMAGTACWIAEEGGRRKERRGER